MSALRTSTTLDDRLDDTPGLLHGGMPSGKSEGMQVRSPVAAPRMVLAAQSDASSSPFSAIRLPRLSLKEAQALSVISRRAVDCYVVPGAHEADAPTRIGSAWRLTITAGRSDPVTQACDMVVHVNWSGARMRLLLPSRAVTVWMMSRLGMDIDEGVDDNLPDNEGCVTAVASIAREAALEAMLGEILDTLGLSGLGKPELIGTETTQKTTQKTSAGRPSELTTETAGVVPASGTGAMHLWLARPLPHHFVVTLQADAAPSAQLRTPFPAQPSAQPSAQLGPQPHAVCTASPEDRASRRPTVMVCLETDGFGVMLIASLLQHLPEKPAPRLHDALRQPLRLIVGGATSTLAALQDLRAGDIVRCDWCSLASQGPKWLAATSATGQRWRLQIDAETPGRLIFLEQSEAENMIDNDAVFDDDHDEDYDKDHDKDHYGERPSGAAYSPRELTGGAARADDDALYSDSEAAGEDSHGTYQSIRSQGGQESIQALETLPVKVSFDLGSVTVALSTLRRWQPGEAIALTAPVSERQVVNIRANGMLIGQGELVDIDGHLGVIVSTLSEAADHE